MGPLGRIGNFRRRTDSAGQRGERRAESRFIEALERRRMLAGQPALLTPAHFRAVPDSVAGIDLSWDGPVVGAEFSAFEVDRAPRGSGKFVSIESDYFFGQEGPHYTYSDQSAVPTFAYDYRVRQLSYDQESPFSTVATATAPLSAPYLSAIGVSISQIDLSWNADGAPFPIEIDRSIDGLRFTKVTVVAASATAYSDKGLNDAVDYFYRLRVVQGSKSVVSGLSDAFTIPKAPIGLTAKAVNTDEIDLTWKNISANAQGADIFRSDDGGKTFNQIAETDDGKTTTYSDLTAQGGHTFRYYVASEVTPPPPEDSPVGVFPEPIDSSPSNTVTMTTPPAGVKDVFAQPISSSQITLTWESAIKGASRIQIYSSTDGRTYAPLSNGLLAGTATTLTVGGLRPDTHYWYEARAIKGPFISGFTPADTYTLALAPSNLQAIVQDSGAVYLTWTSNSGPDSTFVVERLSSIDGTPYWNETTISVTGTHFQDTFDSPGQTIKYTVVALNSSDVYGSAPSNTVIVTQGFPAGPVARKAYAPQPRRRTMVSTSVMSRPLGG